MPEYRGSTTVYYGLLNDGNCGVTAILLKPEIDNGDIVARKSTAPPSSVDIDHLYDNAIRADLFRGSHRMDEKSRVRGLC